MLLHAWCCRWMFAVTMLLLLDQSLITLVDSLSTSRLWSWSSITCHQHASRVRVLPLQATNLPSSSNHEALLNQRLKELGEEELDFALIKRTIAEWQKPLPNHYLSRPLVLVGPSGVGKGRLVKSLLKDYTRFFIKIVTHTTRGPRPDETSGTSYHFIANTTFHEKVKDGYFLEWAKVHDNFYGISMEAWQTARRTGKITIMEIDVQGARTIRSLADSYGLKPKYLFIAPPSIDMLKERLLIRGSETPEQIQLRIQSALNELEESKRPDTIFDMVLLNDDYQKTVNTLFRTMRDWYPALPSAARIRMIQRRLHKIKLLGSTPTTIVSASSDGDSSNENSDDDGNSDYIGSHVTVSSSHHTIGSSGSSSGSGNDGNND